MINNTKTIMDITEILEFFDITEMRNLIYEQIPLENEGDVFLSANVNYFQPIYADYQNSIQNSPEEFHQEIIEKFQQICMIYINRICKKFSLTIDTNWLEENCVRIPVITMALYSFFILDFASNLQEAMLKYILQHKSELYKIFENLKNQKDSSTIVDKKQISDEEISLIASNIFSITTYILQDMMELNDFLELTSDSTTGTAVKNMINESILAGNLMESIQEIYEANMQIRSNIGFEIVCKLKEQYKIKEN